MGRKRVLLATGNRKKAREVKQLLADVGADFICLADLPGAPRIAENGATFLENAEKKARVCARVTGLITVGEDSGLEVDALDGAPGVLSARFAGEGATDAENVARLLELLRHIPAGQRTARFKCAVAIVAPDGTARTAEGACEGSITFAPRGEGGFGYDPVFVPAGGALTLAEIDLVTKGAVSHRGIALRRIKPELESWLARTEYR